jgi:outer membrane lipoprotein carrier protein
MPNLFARGAGATILLAHAALARADGAADADAAALATVEKAIAALDSVRAEFVQELLDKDGKSVERAVGTLYLKKPGRFRWDYSEPKQLIVSDGNRLWLYDPELEQATVRKVRDTLSQTPAMLLAGESKVADGFTVSAAGRDGGLDWVRLIPKQTDTDFKELRLGFLAGSLKRLEFDNKLNQRTRVDLTRIEKNARLPDSLFRFTAPPGVDVIGPSS